MVPEPNPTRILKTRKPVGKLFEIPDPKNPRCYNRTTSLFPETILQVCSTQTTTNGNNITGTPGCTRSNFLLILLWPMRLLVVSVMITAEIFQFKKFCMSSIDCQFHKRKQEFFSPLFYSFNRTAITKTKRSSPKNKQLHPHTK